MNYSGIVIGLVLSGFGAVSAQPAWVKQQAWDQVQQSQMRSMMGRFWGDPKAEKSAIPAFVTIFTKAKTYQGLGHFRLQSGSSLLGVKETAYFRLDGKNFFPEMTDSIEYMGETGLKGESGWLFRTLQGEITAFSPIPAGPATHVSYDNGPIKEIKDGELEKALQSTPIAWAFLNTDRDFALRLFNQYHSIDVYDPKAGFSLSELRSGLFYDNSNWSKEKVKPSDGLAVKLAKVRCWCRNRLYDDGLGVLGDLEGKYPELYLPYLIEGECYEKQGNKKAALAAYIEARAWAPEDQNLMGKLTEGISRLSWETREK
jgi:hypothetical protein